MYRLTNSVDSQVDVRVQHAHRHEISALCGCFLPMLAFSDPSAFISIASRRRLIQPVVYESQSCKISFSPSPPASFFLASSTSNDSTPSSSSQFSSLEEEMDADSLAWIPVFASAGKDGSLYLWIEWEDRLLRIAEYDALPSLGYITSLSFSTRIDVSSWTSAEFYLCGGFSSGMVIWWEILAVLESWMSSYSNEFELVKQRKNAISCRTSHSKSSEVQPPSTLLHARNSAHPTENDMNLNPCMLPTLGHSTPFHRHDPVSNPRVPSIYSSFEVQNLCNTKLFSLRSFKEKKLHSSCVNRVRVSADGNFTCTTSLDETFCIVDTSFSRHFGSLLQKLSLESFHDIPVKSDNMLSNMSSLSFGFPTDACSCFEGERLIMSSSDGSLSFWDIQPISRLSSCIFRYRPSYSEPMSCPPMLSVCFHPKLPSRCVSTDGAGRIHWWTIEYAGLSYDGHVDLDPLVGTLLTDGVDGAWSLLFSSDGSRILIRSLSKIVSVIDADTRMVLWLSRESVTNSDVVSCICSNESVEDVEIPLRSAMQTCLANTRDASDAAVFCDIEGKRFMYPRFDSSTMSCDLVMGTCPITSSVSSHEGMSMIEALATLELVREKQSTGNSHHFEMEEINRLVKESTRARKRIQDLHLPSHLVRSILLSKK